MARSLKNLLHGVFKNENWKVKLLSEWDTIVGNLADKMRLEKIDDQTLFIGVYQSSWMQELYLLSNVLKKTINDHLGYNHVKHLRFKYASKKIITKQPVKKTIPQLKPRKPITLSGQEQQALGVIKDPELKQALHGFLSRCHHQKVTK
jgi:hypothetical protein